MLRMYEVTLERRRGPLGILKTRKPAGQLVEESSYSFRFDPDNVVDLNLNKHHVLTIKTNHPEIPVAVKFSAEPGRTRPEVIVRLDTNNPEIQTFRRKIAIAKEDDGKTILILEAPKFQTRYMTPREASQEIVTGLFSK